MQVNTGTTETAANGTPSIASETILNQTEETTHNNEATLDQVILYSKIFTTIKN